MGLCYNDCPLKSNRRSINYMTNTNESTYSFLSPLSRFFELHKIGNTLESIVEIQPVFKKVNKTDTHKDLYYTLPGVVQSRINLEYKEGFVYLTVEPLSEEDKENSQGYLAFPRGYQGVDYVGNDVDPDSVNAESENGVLKVSFGIKESEQKKDIPINFKNKEN